MNLKWNIRVRRFTPAMALLVGLTLTGCASYMPYSGPRASSMDDVAHDKAMSGIQLVDVNYAISDRKSVV